MVIFGAGASFDSAQAYPSNNFPWPAIRPPLSDALFGDREPFHQARKLFPQFKPVLGQLIYRDGATVEQVLQRLQDEATTYPRGHEQLAAIRYYLQWILTQTINSWDADVARNATCQLALIDQIQRSRGSSDPVCFVTFNYDMLLERALGRAFASMSDYVGHTEFNLFKLHGSVNWGHRVKTPLNLKARNDANEAAGAIISRADSLDIAEDYEITHGTPPDLIDSVQFFPALALPVEGKRHFECPEQHLNELRLLLPKVDKILTIGWRATEAHFLEMLEKHLSRHITIVACSGSKAFADATLDKLRTARIAASFNSLNDGFSLMVSKPQLLRDFFAGC